MFDWTRIIRRVCDQWSVMLIFCRFRRMRSVIFVKFSTEMLLTHVILWVFVVISIIHVWDRCLMYFQNTQTHTLNKQRKELIILTLFRSYIIHYIGYKFIQMHNIFESVLSIVSRYQFHFFRHSHTWEYYIAILYLYIIPLYWYWYFVLKSTHTFDLYHQSKPMVVRHVG